MRNRVSAALRDRPGQQSGQAVVLVAFAMLAILAMTALVVSAGGLYLQRRNAQELADAAALAGATQIPCSLPNAEDEITAVVSNQLGTSATPPPLSACTTPSPTPVSEEAGDGPTWSYTQGGATVSIWYPYADDSHIEVWVATAATLPLEGMLGGSGSLVRARAVAMTSGDSFPSNFALYAQQGITCDGNSPVNVYGSVYAGTSVGGNCTLYAHQALAADGTSIIDQGNVLVQGSGQQWSQGGAADCAGDEPSGNVICADGYEESSSACPTTPGTTDFLQTSRIDYPCPTRTVPQVSWSSFPLAQASSEPNNDPNVTNNIGGACPVGSAGASAYQPLTLPGTSTVIGRMAGQTSTNAPAKDSNGYWHFAPGCYGWLDLSRIGTTNPVVFNPGFYYFSGFSASSDPDTYGGLCLGGGTRAVGNDVLFEFTSTSSLSTSSCAQSPTSATSSGLGSSPAITDGGETYGALSAPNTCDTTADPQCTAASTWCPIADPVCNGLLVWAPPTLSANQTTGGILGTFYAKGSAESSLDGTIFWPGACQWTANYSSTISGQLLCQTTDIQGGKGKVGKQGMTIHFGGVGSNTLPSNSQLTE